MSSKDQHPTILQIIPELSTGGAEKTALDIGDALVKIGWTSLVASAGGRMLEQLTKAGSRHFELPLASKNPVTIWRNAARLEQLIREQKVDLVHARSRAPAWSALIAARRCGVPFVTTYHGAYNQRTYLKGLYNSVMVRADRIIANSEWTRDLIVSRSPNSRDRITVIHRGTDFKAFQSDAISKERCAKLRAAWNVSSKDFVVLHLARLTGWKGQGVLIDAAAALFAEQQNKHLQLRFVLAGDAQGRTDYLDSLKSRIAGHNLQNVVSLPGHCDDPAAAMAVADAVVVASIEAEAFGRAAVEAGALEKPVIVTRIGAVGETVIATPDVPVIQSTGWKVTPGNAEEMAVALHEILAMTRAQRQAVGKRARKHGQEHFSLEQMCSKTIAVYEELLAD